MRCGLLPDGNVQPRFWPRRALGCNSRFLGFHGDTITANILKRLFIINHMAVDLLNTVVTRSFVYPARLAFNFLKCKNFIPFVALPYSAAGVVRRNTSFASRLISFFCVL